MYAMTVFFLPVLDRHVYCHRSFKTGGRRTSEKKRRAISSGVEHDRTSAASGGDDGGTNLSVGASAAGAGDWRPSSEAPEPAHHQHQRLPCHLP